MAAPKHHIMSAGDMYLGACEGVRRRLAHVNDGANISDVDLWRIDMIGAMAEIAVAREVKLDWHPFGLEGGPDVGRRIQVRHTPKHTGHLALHKPPKDNPDHLYIHVTGWPPYLQMHGWCAGYTGQKEHYWGDHAHTGRPCFWIPSEHLAALSLLPPNA